MHLQIAHVLQVKLYKYQEITRKKMNSPSCVTSKWQKITSIPVGCTGSRTCMFCLLLDSDVLLGTYECRSSLETLPLIMSLYW